ncbi:heavy metal-responsive transcriptional regulator [Leptolyngbya sp. AN02str]|uniref:heavy metal-responsive transcriptional regulator n=1 Tax=Leptolyngbya sp. AN02str TaxID=3423363 RepID=UPI003D322C55
MFTPAPVPGSTPASTPSQPKLIGTVAKESGIPIKTIRYYEDLGLLRAVGRTEGGYRLFGADVGDRLNFIKRAQSLGLTLAEIREFLTIHDQGNKPCTQVTLKLQDKLLEIDRQIQQLRILKQELEELTNTAHLLSNTTESSICPIIEHASIA